MDGLARSKAANSEKILRPSIVDIMTAESSDAMMANHENDGDSGPGCPSIDPRRDAANARVRSAHCRPRFYAFSRLRLPLFSVVMKRDAATNGRLAGWTWIDTLLCLACVAVAAGLRFWNLTSLGLTHFDEGSYALAGRWLATLGAEGHPFEAGHAPPLFPTLAGISFVLFGVRDTAAIAVSAAAGSLTAGLFYVCGACWFGRGVGAAAALLLASCQYHLIYSRMALTDALFSLLFWAAAGAFLEAATSNSRRWWIAGGVLTALCWNTKYHGFFPLLIAGLWLIIEGLSRGRLRERMQFGSLSAAAAIAAAGFLPWTVAVAATVGWNGVLRGQLEHSLGTAGVTATSPWTIYFYLTRWMTWPLLTLALAGVCLALRRRRREALYVSWVTFFLAASALFYLSFPRLVLPVAAGLCLLAGYGAAEICRILPAPASRPALILTIAAALTVNLLDARPMIAQKTDSYRRAAEILQQFQQPVITQLSKNFYFYGRTPFLEMRRHDRARLDAIAARSGEAIVAIDPVIDRLPGPKLWLEQRRRNLDPIRRIPVEAYEPVYFQGIDPYAGFENLPRSVAPAAPGQAAIEIFLLSER